MYYIEKKNEELSIITVQTRSGEWINRIGNIKYRTWSSVIGVLTIEWHAKADFRSSKIGIRKNSLKAKSKSTMSS